MLQFKEVDKQLYVMLGIPSPVKIDTPTPCILELDPNHVAVSGTGKHPAKIMINNKQDMNKILRRYVPYFVSGVHVVEACKHYDTSMNEIASALNENILTGCRAGSSSMSFAPLHLNNADVEIAPQLEISPLEKGQSPKRVRVDKNTISMKYESPSSDAVRFALLDVADIVESGKLGDYTPVNAAGDKWRFRYVVKGVDELIVIRVKRNKYSHNLVADVKRNYDHKLTKDKHDKIIMLKDIVPTKGKKCK